MKANPARTTAIVWAIITIIAAVMVFAPEMVGIEGMNGGYAISFVGLFFVIMGIIIVIIYVGRAMTLDKILGGENLLAHWTYTSEKWKDYAEKEHAADKAEKRGLFCVISGFALFFGILFWIIDPEAGFYVFLAMLGLVLIIGLTALATSGQRYRQNRKYLGEVYIAKDALYLNRQLHTWRSLGASLVNVAFENDESLPLLTFKYSAPTLTGLQYYTVRVPVPPGQEEKAKEIASQLNA